MFNIDKRSKGHECGQNLYSRGFHDVEPGNAAERAGAQGSARRPALQSVTTAVP